MRKFERTRVKTDFKNVKSVTKTSEITRTDIRKMIGQGVSMPDPSEFYFGDFSDGDDYQTMQDRVVSVKTTFDSLPSQIRKLLDNNPANMLDIIANDPQSAIKLGLINENDTKDGTTSSRKSTADDQPRDSQTGDQPSPKTPQETGNEPVQKT